MKRTMAVIFIGLGIYSMVNAARAQGVLTVNEAPIHGDVANSSSQTMVLDFANGQPLTINGNLTNSGKIYALSSNPQISSGVINITNLFNHSGASISSIVPAGGIPGLSGVFSSLTNLTFNAQTSFRNEGIITANNLAVVAPIIVNGPFSGHSGAHAVMQAINNLNLSAMSVTNQGIMSSQLANATILAAQIANSGTIQASQTLAIQGLLNSSLEINNPGGLLSAANINVGAMGDILINNTGGTMQALSGQISVRDSSYSGTGNVAIWGGDITSRELNLFSGSGTAAIDVNSTQSIVNITAAQARVTVASDILKLGRLDISGDPTFYNTVGDVLLDTDLVFRGQPLAIVATGNILTQTTLKIDTSSTTLNGGNILLVAGAKFTASAPAGDPFAPVNLTISGGSITGGRIDLSGSTVVSSASSAPGGSGGNVGMIAFAGVDPASGTIKVPANVTVTTGGAGNGNNGDVLFLGTPSPNAVGGGVTLALGNVDTRGGAASGGDIRIYTSTAVASSKTGNCNTCAFVQNGELINGSQFTPPPSVPYVGTISAGSLAAPGTYVGIKTGGSLLTGSIIDNGAGAKPGGTVEIQGGGSSVFTIGGGATNGVNGTISAASGPQGGGGGNILIGTTDIPSSAPSIAAPIVVQSLSNLNVSAAGGKGGTIYINTTGLLSIPGGQLSVDGTGGNFNGGSLNLNGGYAGLQLTLTGVQHLQLSANGSGSGNGGTITVGTLSQLTLGNGPGDVSLSATGGSPGSASGDGGAITLVCTNVLAVISGFINFAPLGLNGTGGSISLSAPGITIPGSISVSGAGQGNGGKISLSSSAGDFTVGMGPTSNGVVGTIQADAGPTGGSGGSINISSAGNLVIGANALSLSATTGNGGTLSLGAGGTLTLPAGILEVNGKGGNFDGGSFNLGGQLVVSGTGPLILTANASGNGNGGNIQVSTGQDLTVGSSTGEVEIFAFGGSGGSTSGNGGSITLSSTGNISVLDMAQLAADPLGASGNGASITLSGDTLFASNSVVANGVGNGDGGSITVSAGSGTLTIAPGVFANGINGVLQANAGANGGKGGSISIDVLNLTLADASSVEVSSPRGAGGSVYIQATILQGNGSVTMGGGTISVDSGTTGGSINLLTDHLSVTGTNPLTLSAQGGISGGTINVSVYNGGISFGFGQGQVNCNVSGGTPGSAGGDGGNLGLFAQNLTVNGSSALQFGPLGLNGSAGTLFLGSLTGSVQATANISADGAGTGNGGVITIYVASSRSAASPSPIYTIGPGAPAGIDGVLSAKGGASGGNGGSILVWINRRPSIPSSVPDLVVSDLSAITVASSGNGGFIGLHNGPFVLTRTQGQVILPSGTLSVSGNGINSAGGSVVLAGSNIVVNGGGVLNLAAAGSGTGSGGSVSLQAFSSNLSIGSQPGQISVQATGGAAGGAGGTFLGQAGFDLLVDPTALSLAPTGTNGDGAKISLSAEHNLSVTGDLSANARGAGNGGIIQLIYNNSTPLTGPFIVGGTVVNSGISKTLTASAPGGGSGGAISILNGQSLAENFNVSSLISVQSSSGNSGTITNGIIYSSPTLTLPLPPSIFTPGSNMISPVSTAPPANVSVFGTGTVLGNIQFQSAGAVDINLPAQTSPVSLGTMNVIGPLTVTAGSVSVPNGTTAASGFGITINTANLVNNGLLQSTTPGSSITVQNSASVTVSGDTGVIQATNIVFNSLSGSVLVHQQALLGTVTGTAAGSFVVTTGKPLTTSAALAEHDAIGLLVAARNIPSVASSDSSTSNTSTVLATDTTHRSISFPEDAGVEPQVANQLYMGVAGSDDSLEIAEEDTEVENTAGQVVLHKGRLTLESGSSPVTVNTQAGLVTVSPNAAVALELNPGKSLHIMALAGGDSAVTVSGKSGKSLAMKPGQELIMAERALSEEEYIPVDGIERGEAISVGITAVGGGQTVKRDFNLMQFHQRQIMVAGHLVQIGRAMSARKKQMDEHIGEAARKQVFRPVNQQDFTVVHGPTGDSGPLKSCPYGQLLGTSDAAWTDNGVTGLWLRRGELFLVPNTKVSVKTGIGMVEATSKSLVSVESSTNVMRVRACSGPGHVTLVLGDVRIPLLPGTEALVSTHPLSGKDFQPQDGIARRAPVVQRSSGKYHYAIADFSLLSMLSHKGYMVSIRGATKSPQQPVREKMLKTAVALNMVFRGRGPYTGNNATP